MAEFIWWHVVDGIARALPDTAATREAIDSGALSPIYGCIEGAIKNGGVQAVAFKRRTVKTYDAVHWLKTREMVEAGTVTETEITAGGQYVEANCR